MAKRVNTGALSRVVCVASLVLGPLALVAQQAGATGGTINQIGSTSAPVPVSGSAAFTSAISTDDLSAVTFTTASNGVVVDASGNLTTTGTLSVGTYTVTGTTSDASSGTGTYTFTLIVTNTPVNQTGTTSASVTAGGSSSFTSSLTTDTSYNPVSFSTANGNGLLVSSSGAVSTTGTLAEGTHVVSGTTTDAYLDTGSYSFSLAVTGPITQTSPASSTTSVAASSSFTTGITTDDVSAVTFSSTPTNGLNVSPSGTVTTGTTLSVGSHVINGTTSDGAGNSGTFSFTLIVSNTAINQTGSLSDSTTVTGSSSYSTSLTTGDTNPVTFSTANVQGLIVSSTGVVSTGGQLAVGAHVVVGTTSDAFGNTGRYTFTLNVSGIVINQTTPTSGSASVLNSVVFSTAIATDDTNPVTFSTATNQGLVVDAAGRVSTTGPLVAGVHVISGTTSDVFGDSGIYTFSLTVFAGSITQTSSTNATTTSLLSTTFTSGPITVSGAVGTVSFTTSISNANLKVSPAGVLSTTGSLTDGLYTINGSDQDGFGDNGIWTFTLTVNRSAQSVTFDANAGSGTMPPQSSLVPIALTPNTFTRSGYAFAGWNTSADGSGTAYADAAQFPFSASANLYAQWRLLVFHTVTFRANGGRGVTQAQRASQPTSLRPSGFTRVGYSFAGWSTGASSRAVQFVDGATYSFGKSLTLFAVWRTGPELTVIFSANGGIGTMRPESHNHPFALLVNGFSRSGYAFAGWNTIPNGSGTSYANAALFPFSASATLYAQWRVGPNQTVTFRPNGGRGGMAPQSAPSPAPLTPVTFTRPGYTFVGWNTSPTGHGAAYANAALFPFSVSASLYAQWKLKKVVVIPGTPGSATLSRFGVGSSAMTPTLDAQIVALAGQIKNHHDTHIILDGYGDTLSKTDALNELRWAKNLTLSINRAAQVEAFLKVQLTTIGVHGYTITTNGKGSAIPPGSTGTPAQQALSGTVLATLS